MSLKEIKATPLSEVFKSTDGIQNLCQLCKDKGKWGMYVALITPNQGISVDDYMKAAPYLKYPENESILLNGFGYFFFEHEDDMQYAFNVTVGDRGPNEWNDYAGPAKVYAVTCGPQGVEVDENT